MDTRTYPKKQSRLRLVYDYLNPQAGWCLPARRKNATVCFNSGYRIKKIKPIVYHIPSFSHCFIIIVPWFTIIVPWFIMVYHHFHQFRIAMLTYVRLIPTHRQVQIHVLRSCFGDEIFSRSV